MNRLCHQTVIYITCCVSLGSKNFRSQKSCTQRVVLKIFTTAYYLNINLILLVTLISIDK